MTFDQTRARLGVLDARSVGVLRLATVLPTALTLHNYRAFAGPQRFELRPLTLIYGENNAGKSALLRSLPLLADSAASDGLDALDFGSRLAHLELDFDSLRWKGWKQTGDAYTVRIDLEWGSEPNAWEAQLSLWQFEEWRRVIIERLFFCESVEVYDWKRRREDRRSSSLRFKYSTPEGFGAEVMRDEITIDFRGLLPSTSVPGHDSLRLLSEHLRYLASRVLWLRSLRPAPGRVCRRSGAVGWALDPLGQDAPFLLEDEPELHAMVSDWYERHLGLELRVDSIRSRELRVAVRSTSEAAFDVDLIDTGEGLSQVLPVLTALAMAELRGREAGPAIVAVEEAEAHLHPTLQRALIARACEVAARSGARIVLETHSRAFLLGAQKAILDGLLREDDVIVYWVRQLADGRSKAEPVALTALGRLDGPWPGDAFESELELAAEIQDLRDAKELG